MKPKIQTLKGFRDFLPTEKKARDFVQQKVIEVFIRFGFEPLETPTLEYADLLLGKYGKEADKLVYTFKDRGGRDIGLRYDQTVPTARVLAQYQHQLPKFFRRYQIQNVFRADKPQKGRYREFTQCDIDIFGTTSPIADAEILACTYTAFENVGFPGIILKLNDRQTLIDTLKPYSTGTVSVHSLIQSIDKLDKLSPEKVAAELVKKGLPLTFAQAALVGITQAKESVNLNRIIDAASDLGIPPTAIQFSPSLARGLDYYTGMIFEVTLKDYSSGSLGGGGRYDNLIQDLGGPKIPAVGIAIGFDRIVDAAVDLNLIKRDILSPTVLIGILDPSCLTRALETTDNLRQNGVNCLLYPEPSSPGKVLKYAAKIPSSQVVLIGIDELNANTVTLKNMSTGHQLTDSLEKIITILKS